MLEIQPAGGLVQPAARSHPHAARAATRTFRPISCTRFKSLLVRLIRGKSCQRQPQVSQDFPRGVLARQTVNRRRTLLFRWYKT